MKLTSTLKIAYKNLIKNKMRSILTSLGIIIGVGSVVIMVAIGTGSQMKIKKQIASLGSNLIMVSQKMSRVGGVRMSGTDNKLTLADADKIKKNCTDVQWVSPFIETSSQVIANGNNWSTSIYGVSPDFVSIRSWKIEQGEFFTAQDSKSKKKVAVIGKTIADELFSGEDPVGKVIRIGNVPFKITGVLAAKGKNSFGMDQDDLIMAPDATVMGRLAGARFIRMIYVSATSEDTMKLAQTEVQNVMREAHDLIDNNKEDDFNIGTQDEIAEAATSTAATLTLLLGAIAGVSLLVGGIGIMNIMLVSVTERTREIGIRMAVGAKSKDIMLQFLIEALVLSIAGGLIGVLLSFLVIFILNSFTSISAVINWNIILLSFIFSGSVGVFFGYYPAKKAANLNPIDALRFE
jgi:putative ABC transport system permease protein